MGVTNANTDLILQNGIPGQSGFGFSNCVLQRLHNCGITNLSALRDYTKDAFSGLQGQLKTLRDGYPPLAMVKLQAVSEMICVYESCGLTWDEATFSDPQMTEWLRYMKVQQEKKDARDSNSQKLAPKLTKNGDIHTWFRDLSAWTPSYIGLNGCSIGWIIRAKAQPWLNPTIIQANRPALKQNLCHVKGTDSIKDMIIKYTLHGPLL